MVDALQFVPASPSGSREAILPPPSCPPDGSALPLDRSRGVRCCGTAVGELRLDGGALGGARAEAAIQDRGLHGLFRKMRKRPVAPGSIRAAAKEAVGFAFRYSGLTALVRATVGRRRVGILVYHDPPVRLFERHLEYLSRHYVFLTLDDLVNAL